jgi:hypothetical protein
VRLRSLLRPRRGLWVDTFLPSGEVTETEGDGRGSNIDWDESHVCNCQSSLGLWKVVSVLLLLRSSQPQAKNVTLQAAGSTVAQMICFRPEVCLVQQMIRIPSSARPGCAVRGCALQLDL